MGFDGEETQSLTGKAVEVWGVEGLVVGVGVYVKVWVVGVFLVEVGGGMGGVGGCVGLWGVLEVRDPPTETWRRVVRGLVSGSSGRGGIKGLMVGGVGRWGVWGCCAHPPHPHMTTTRWWGREGNVM